MIRIFGDFETYYDVNYSLRKMSPIEYILHAQWETLGCAVAIEHETPILLPRDDIASFLKDIKQPYAFISHNALFDACVLAYRYGIHPPALFCTLSMARATTFHAIPNGRLSLANLLKFFGFTEKGDFIHQMRGKHWADLANDPGMLMLFSAYAINDVEGCREIFFRLRDQISPAEAMIMDRVIRMATQPILHVDMVGLADYRAEVRAHKSELLARVKMDDPSILASNPKFATLLESYGVEPPMKPSPSNPEKWTYAFAKTDQAFTDLLEHDNPDVQALVAARLGIKTTIEETRSTRMINIGLCTNSFLDAPYMPVPLKYSGAHTHRLSGDWLLNMQNLSARKSKAIRSCIYAPEGCIIIAGDASQIEARLTAWIAGQLDLLEMFAAGTDTYKAFASDIFKVAIALVSKVQRFVGKTCILGLGFGMSDGKLYRSILTLAREQGIEVEITIENCIEWVQIYRRRFRAIKQCWYDLNDLIERMSRGEADGWTVGPCTVDGTSIILPSGLRLFYDNLHLENNEYWYQQAQFQKKIYGAKCLENIVQALDRQHVTEAGMRAEMRARKMGIPDPRVLWNIHDENIHCVPIEYKDAMAQIVLEEMERNVAWSEGLPLAAEVKVGMNLGELEAWRP